MMHGFVNIAKPPHITSRRVVDQIQRHVPGRKVGHAGTLDPLATGVLVVGIGQATRLTEFVRRMPKTYRATFLLGRTSASDDIEAEVLELEPAPIPRPDELERALAQLRGTIWQVPPAYSALRVGGRRAYRLARAGKAPSLPARPVSIHRLETVAYRYPELIVHLECTAGTYVRSVGRDLARSLGTGAVMSALERLAVGPFRLPQALSLTGLTPERLQAALQPIETALADLGQVSLSDEQCRRVRQGQTVQADWPGRGPLVALDGQQKLVAIMVPRASGRWGPKKTF